MYVNDYIYIYIYKREKSFVVKNHLCVCDYWQRDPTQEKISSFDREMMAVMAL